MGKKKVGLFIIDLEAILGKGTFATVYKAVVAQTKEMVASKVIDKAKIKADPYTRNAFEQQIRIMMKLKSDNIIRFIDINETSSNYYIFLQIADQGELRNILQKKNRLTEKEALGYIVQLLNAFGEMFKIGVIHRDIKPENIFVKNDVLKIGDFGFAKANSQLDNMMSTTVGSPAYMAPQILNEQKYSYKCDIWSLGIMAYEMLIGRTPFDLKTRQLKQLYKTIANSVLSFPGDVPISDNMKDFIKGCLKITQQQRFDWSKVFLHPLFKGLFQKNFQGLKKGEQILGYIMASFRMIIHEKNINVKAQFNRLEKESLSCEEFQAFLKYLNCNMKKQQAKTLCDILQKNGKVFLTEFESLLQKYGCKVKDLVINSAVLETQNDDATVLSKNLIRKTNNEEKIDFFNTLSQKSQNTGKINVQDFQAALKNSVPQIPRKAIPNLFQNLFGISDKNEVTIDKFMKIMSKVCQQMPGKKKA